MSGIALRSAIEVMDRLSRKTPVTSSSPRIFTRLEVVLRAGMVTSKRVADAKDCNVDIIRKKVTINGNLQGPGLPRPRRSTGEEVFHHCQLPGWAAEARDFICNLQFYFLFSIRIHQVD